MVYFSQHMLNTFIKKDGTHMMEQENPFLLPEQKEFVKKMVSFCKSGRSAELVREAIKWKRNIRI